MAKTTELRVIIAGGGTGGHFFPGLAVAQAVLAAEPGARVLFVGSASGIEAHLAPQHGFAFKALPAAGFVGVPFAKRIRAAFALPAALALGAALLLVFKPSAVVGVGGYASFPLALAAGLTGIPLILLEQNVKPGLANRLLTPLAAVVAASFPQSLRWFRGKGRLIGNPVREALAEVPREAGPERPLRLLVFGGSRGANAINRAVTGALPELGAFPGGIEVLHQTGAEDLEWVREAYAASRVRADVRPFIHDMASAYAWCHAALCRAGATTLAELCAARRPALLVPFPHSAGGHQLENARGLEALGGARVIEQKDLTTDSLLSALAALADRGERARMASFLAAAARPAAARDIASLVLKAGGCA
jgi:UDP-N-acetylglucosamine--N-acetylmuramyl-(pentapeptide) pyrophosphoryl-undecaprenol N-acetylglucosamine transferase